MQSIDLCLSFRPDRPAHLTLKQASEIEKKMPHPFYLTLYMSCRKLDLPSFGRNKQIQKFALRDCAPCEGQNFPKMMREGISTKLSGRVRYPTKAKVKVDEKRKNASAIPGEGARAEELVVKRQ